MNYLTKDEADKYLTSIGMRIGSWNQIEDIDHGAINKSAWINYPAPGQSQTLLNFSQHVAGWIPNGKWKLLQIDNSSNFDSFQKNLIATLLLASPGTINFDNHRSFLFEFGNDQDENDQTELQISNLLYAFLLLESHAYLVSSNSVLGERIAIQDGFTYFCSASEGLIQARSLLDTFERHPLTAPEWILEIINRDFLLPDSTEQ